MVSSRAGLPPSTVQDLPNHVLELILLRLDSSIFLVRAASACKRWCRVVADAGFQGHFRRRNGLRLILGHYVSRHGDAAFVPSPTIPSIYSRQSFDLDFVPMVDGSWEIADGRGCLLFLRKRHWKKWCRRLNPDLVVCEPLTRRYRAVSVLPDMLRGCPDLGLYFLEGGAGGLSDFKFMAVLLMEHRGRGVPKACKYSQGDGTWHNFDCAWEGNRNIPSRASNFVFAGRANGSLYWGIVGGGAAHAALVLDEATAGVSQVTLPDGVEGWHDGRCLRMIGGEDGGTLRAVCLIDSELRVYARLRGGAGWVLQNLLQLLDNPIAIIASPMIVAAHEMYVLVAPKHSQWLFCVDLKTMAVERLPRRNVYKEWQACAYELWPPVLKISAESPRKH